MREAWQLAGRLGVGEGAESFTQGSVGSGNRKLNKVYLEHI